MARRWLVGDVGGTSCRFAWAEPAPGGGVALSGTIKFEKDGFSSLAEGVERFLAAHGSGVGGAGTSEASEIHALFALAGPLQPDGSITLTNREDWPTVLPNALEKACGIHRVVLTNDFAAMARSIPELGDGDFVEIRGGTADPSAPVMVTGPGTGFGVGTLIPSDGGWRVLTGEGGHAAYAAHTVREAELAERLSATHGYVSTEMVVSGRWLQPVFDQLSDMHNQPRETVPAGEILARAEAGDAVCEEVCALRARAIMGAAGDLVLINGAKGGAVLTGGVAERMIRWLKWPEALARFSQRGQRTDYMKAVPVHVVTNAEAPLMGAAALLFEQDT